MRRMSRFVVFILSLPDALMPNTGFCRIQSCGKGRGANAKASNHGLPTPARHRCRDNLRQGVAVRRNRRQSRLLRQRISDLPPAAPHVEQDPEDWMRHVSAALARLLDGLPKGPVAAAWALLAGQHPCVRRRVRRCPAARHRLAGRALRRRGRGARCESSGSRQAPMVGRAAPHRCEPCAGAHGVGAEKSSPPVGAHAVGPVAEGLLPLQTDGRSRSPTPCRPSA